MRILSFRNSLFYLSKNLSHSSHTQKSSKKIITPDSHMPSLYKRKNNKMLNISYYYVKPFILRKMQIFLRRNLAKRKKREVENIWPIYRGSEKLPPNWPGWPIKKKFALILTHDIERQKGYDKVLKLMELEKNLGFVSAFFFVPERDYKVQKEILSKLKTNGFEYGVHGLKHDGKLFKNKRIFEQRSVKINNYLKEWGCSGFRAPAMHHNLNWINALNIKYDLSTFDTDPFEPQPDGVNTIYPFWSGGNNCSEGYVEMPYTLPQDHTLFIILQEKNNQIWKNKLDWIAENGGMALLDVHPDYINFNNKYSGEEYPIELYEQFLLYIKNKYENEYWNVLPETLAQFYLDNICKNLK